MHNPFGGTNRIRFTGYNLSPLPASLSVGHPFVFTGAKIYTFSEKKLLLGVFFLFGYMTFFV